MAKNAKKVSLKGANTSMLRWDQRTIGFIVVLIVAVVGTYLLTSSYASPAPKTVGNGTCSANPTSPTAGTTPYYIVGSNIPGGYNDYQAWVSNSTGLVLSGMPAPDANGTTQQTAYAYHAGSYSVEIKGITWAKSGSKTTILATCTYTVQ